MKVERSDGRYTFHLLGGKPDKWRHLAELGFKDKFTALNDAPQRRFALFRHRFC
jgi:hypothetical protein